ncbi:hypothetical protein [uncultured Gelidibacter sp.]|uniref:hypothetical protein n=1 Tax=uncultured Gelidibacter sp. TaxID=259318 RepID=UPI00261F9B91|nr:hypothetical protein [uncultured Gelidibacter sp.]
MRKTLLIIFIVIGITSCKSQEVSGIWMSYNNRVIEDGQVTTTRDEGIIIDFDKQTIGNISTDSIIGVKIDFKESKIFLNSDTLNIHFKTYQKDSIEIDFGRNMMHVFRPINLEHKLTIDKDNIIEFLTQNKYKKINEYLSLNFLNDMHFYATLYDRKNDKRFLKSQIDKNGYWFVKELKGNFFLIFAVEEIGEQNIYQITKLTKCQMELKPMQEYGEWIIELTELKTCL